MTDQKNIRVRMAPSPTGFMHIGTLRTVLYDDLFARKNGGKLILRIEDTDQSREVEGAVENLLKMLNLTDITHDEGPFLEGGQIVEKGDYGPYTQSKRLDIYKEHVQKLLDEEKAYQCFCTSERLDEMRKEQQRMKQSPMYDRTCLEESRESREARVEKGEKYVVRMKVPRGEEVIVDDIVRGKVVFQSDTVDDQVIMKSDGFPTYHLAVVVDDYLMQISHVVRGEEWLPSTPKHIILYNMFGWDLPAFAHLPLLLNADKSKLSKRQGDVAVEDFLAKGYLKEALINFVAFLGWHPGGGETREIYSHEELVEAFDMSKVHKAGAVVDINKLNKINAHYIKNSNTEKLWDENANLLLTSIGEMGTATGLGIDFNQKFSKEFYVKVLEIEKERLEKLEDFGKENPFFFGDITVEKDLLRWKENADEDTVKALEGVRGVLTDLAEEDWTRENLQQKLMDAAGEDRGSFLWPLRAALTGAKRSPSPMDCAWVLGKEETLSRTEKALDTLK